MLSSASMMKTNSITLLAQLYSDVKRTIAALPGSQRPDQLNPIETGLARADLSYPASPKAKFPTQGILRISSNFFGLGD